MNVGQTSGLLGTDDVLVRCDGYIIHCLGDRRLSKAQYETKKTGTDDVLVQCDGYIIHCLSDRRLSKAQYETKKTGMILNCNANFSIIFKLKPSPSSSVTKIYKYGTDDLLVRCDGYIIHCLSDRRLSKAQYETKETEDQVICNTINEREELAATVKTIENGKFAENSLIILNRCVRYGYGLCCRLLFKYTESLYSNHCLMTAFNKSIHLSIKASDDPEKARHVDTAKAIAWQITRMFYINQKDQHIFTNIYPAFKCICENKTCTEIFCSDDLYIVVEVSNYIPTLTTNYEGLKIYQQYTRDTLSEGLLISQQQQLYLRSNSCSVALLHGVSWAFANQCFINYSNLISIVPSFLRSKRFNSEKHTFTVEKCATFTCRVKGLIPIGEMHFPDLVKASDGTIVQTDVIEGRVNHANLMVGDHIESTTMSGTLGGYLLYYTRKCFMTCAHVMLDEQSMISRKKYPIHNKDLSVFVKDEHGRRIKCGTALRCDFETGSDTKSGIDVAIIEMNAQCKVNPNSMVEDKAKNLHSYLYLGMSDEYLNDNCIDHELLTLTNSQVETMAFGRLTTIENCKTHFEPEQIIEIELKKIGTGYRNCKW
ncbi:unnamed protein product [Mytilus coruscus]|uniref:Uncharacterized protein n=1 Tax=Mytilus coruscus TaxID=42192 RepID=A0A6J7ZTM1_MYTCO|nr:unnamed protein product [Mytilus coruscus]